MNYKKKQGGFTDPCDTGGFQDPSNSSSGSLRFDDVPLETILYGSDKPEPTPASLYSRFRELVDRFFSAAIGKDFPETIRQALRIEHERWKLSTPMCSRIVAGLHLLIPIYPVPEIRDDISPLTRLLEGILQIADDRRRPDLEEECVRVLYRCHDMEGNYEDSRRILRRLIKIQEEKGTLEEEGSSINSYGFAYWTEKRYGDAIPFFCEAIEKFQKSGALYRVPNARANYWDCCLAAGREVDLKEIEAFSHQLLSAVRNGVAWQVRKPYLLLSRIRLRQGRIDAAIRFARKVCKISGKEPGLLSKIDSEWLAQLLEQKHSMSS